MEIDEKNLFGSDSESDSRSLPDDAEESRNEQTEENEISEFSERHSLTIEAHVPTLEPLKNQNQLHLVNMPNFLAVDPFPFDASTYQEITAEDETEKETGVIVENTIRWRYAPGEQSRGSNARKESNARFIRWSDGSLSLLVGSEMFEVTTKQHPKNQFQYVYSRHASAELMQAQAKIDGTMAFRPLSTNSRTHKKLSASLLHKHHKVKKTKFISSIANPEAAKIALEKSEMEAIRNRKKLEAQRRNRGGRVGGELTAADLEEEEDDAEMEQRVRRRQQQQYQRSRDYDDEEEEDDDGFVVDDDQVEYASDEEEIEEDDDEADEKLLSAKRGLERGDGTQVERMDVDGEEGGEKSTPNAASRRRVIVSDDEDD